VSIDRDFHAHSTYSDGEFLRSMLGAAEAAGLDGIGIADHCNVSEREPMRRTSRNLGFNLDLTYERRREAIDYYRGEFDVAVYDAVEVDYDPRDEAAIREFLDEAGFDYAIGSVHHVEDVNVHVESYFGRKSEAERAEAVEDYFGKLVDLIESELFAVAAHPDLVERNPALRGYATAEQYDRVADAFADSRTAPELNAGRAFDDYGEYHPSPAFLDALLDRGVDVTVGSDAHEPGVVAERAEGLDAKLEELGVEPVSVV
jgi:histidinol-phosphatase (PHP family)